MSEFGQYFRNSVFVLKVFEVSALVSSRLF